jgi:ATP adenylyltransferase
MEKLWSPWRSQYIESFKDKNKSSSCVFCSAVKQEMNDDSSLVVEKGEHTFTVLNLYPYNNGHLMVVPHKHINNIDALINDEKIEIFNKVQLAMNALKKISNPDGFNIGANLGKVAGAGIDEHIHFHIVPRWNGDTNFMPVLGEVKILSQDLLDTKKKLISAYSELKGK